jgi:hypothetical protein
VRSGDAPGNEARQVLDQIERRRALGPVLHLEVDGSRLEVAFGDSVTIGRSDATLRLSAPGLSRVHLQIQKGLRGPAVSDCSSRNGTLVAGARLTQPLELSAELDLLLAGEVRVSVRPSRGGAELIVAGRRVFAPLSPLRIGAWQIDCASDGWLELRAPDRAPVYLNGTRAEGQIELCEGDQLSEAPQQAPRLRVLP